MSRNLFMFVAAALVSATSAVSAQTPSDHHPTITTITTQGGRLDWGPNGRIAFDTLANGTHFEVSIMRPDGTDVHCLTCGRPELPAGRHRGNPAWHPSGNYIAFQAEQAWYGNEGGFGQRRLGRRMGRRGGTADGGQASKLLDFVARPGAGFRNDLWLMDATGQHFWKLASTDPRKGAILHAHFSHKGDRLSWSERNGTGGFWGHWQLKVADFIVDDGTPHLSNTQSYEPGKGGFYENHGFSTDDRKLLFTADPESGPQTALDIYSYDLTSKKLLNLTHSPDAWDEHAHYSPSGRTIVWMSSQGLNLPATKAEIKSLRTEFWIMDPDGGNKQQVTSVHEPGHPESIAGGAVCADSDWSPDGSKVAGFLQINSVAGEGHIIIIDFGRPM